MRTPAGGAWSPSTLGPTVSWHAAAAAAAVAIGFGVVAAPEAALAAIAVFIVALLTLLGGSKRVFATIIVLGAVPVVVGLASHGELTQAAFTYLDDAALALGFAPLALAVAELRGENKTIALAVLTLLIASEAVGMVGSQGGLALGAHAAWQDLRWLGAIGWGLYLARYLSARGRFAWSYYMLTGWSVAQLATALVQILRGEGPTKRFFIPEVGGVFGHPSLGAMAGTALLLLVTSDVLSSPSFLSWRQRLLGASVALSALAVSTRVKPLLAFAGLLAFYLAKRLIRSHSASALAVVILPMVIFFALSQTTESYTRTELQTGALAGDVASHAPPRATLVKGALNLARQEFPHGAGLGTYGSGLDSRVEPRTFTAAGLPREYGFFDKGPSFQSDSLLAHVLAERGWAGLVIWLTALVMLTGLFMRLSGHLFPSAILIGSLFLAPVAPSFNDGPTAFLLFLPAGLCLDPFSTGASPPEASDAVRLDLEDITTSPRT